VGGLNPGLRQVLVGDDDELPFGVLVAFRDLAPAHLDTLGAAHPAVLNRRQIRAVKLAKVDLLRGFARRVEAHRNGDEPEADAAFPDRPGHGGSVPRREERGTDGLRVGHD
jgi:hypothetical protein